MVEQYSGGVPEQQGGEGRPEYFPLREGIYGLNWERKKRVQEIAKDLEATYTSTLESLRSEGKDVSVCEWEATRAMVRESVVRLASKLEDVLQPGKPIGGEVYDEDYRRAVDYKNILLEAVEEVIRKGSLTFRWKVRDRLGEEEVIREVPVRFMEKKWDEILKTSFNALVFLHNVGVVLSSKRRENPKLLEISKYAEATGEMRELIEVLSLFSEISRVDHLFRLHYAATFHEPGHYGQRDPRVDTYFSLIKEFVERILLHPEEINLPERLISASVTFAAVRELINIRTPEIRDWADPFLGKGASPQYAAESTSSIFRAEGIKNLHEIKKPTLGDALFIDPRYPLPPLKGDKDYRRFLEAAKRGSLNRGISMVVEGRFFPPFGELASIVNFMATSFDQEPLSSLDMIRTYWGYTPIPDQYNPVTAGGGMHRLNSKARGPFEIFLTTHTFPSFNFEFQGAKELDLSIDDYKLLWKVAERLGPTYMMEIAEKIASDLSKMPKEDRDTYINELIPSFIESFGIKLEEKGKEGQEGEGETEITEQQRQQQEGEGQEAENPEVEFLQKVLGNAPAKELIDALKDVDNVVKLEDKIVYILGEAFAAIPPDVDEYRAKDAFLGLIKDRLSKEHRTLVLASSIHGVDRDRVEEWKKSMRKEIIRAFLYKLIMARISVQLPATLTLLVELPQWSQTGVTVREEILSKFKENYPQDGEHRFIEAEKAIIRLENSLVGRFTERRENMVSSFVGLRGVEDREKFVVDSFGRIPTIWEEIEAMEDEVKKELARKYYEYFLDIWERSVEEDDGWKRRKKIIEEIVEDKGEDKDKVIEEIKARLKSRFAYWTEKVMRGETLGFWTPLDQLLDVNSFGSLTLSWFSSAAGNTNEKLIAVLENLSAIMKEGKWMPFGHQLPPESEIPNVVEGIMAFMRAKQRLIHPYSPEGVHYDPDREWGDVSQGAFFRPEDTEDAIKLAEQKALHVGGRIVDKMTIEALRAVQMQPGERWKFIPFPNFQAGMGVEELLKQHPELLHAYPFPLYLLSIVNLLVGKPLSELKGTIEGVVGPESAYKAVHMALMPIVISTLVLDADQKAIIFNWFQEVLESQEKKEPIYTAFNIGLDPLSDRVMRRRLSPAGEALSPKNLISSAFGAENTPLHALVAALVMGGSALSSAPLAKALRFSVELDKIGKPYVARAQIAPATISAIKLALSGVLPAIALCEDHPKIISDRLFRVYRPFIEITAHHTSSAQEPEQDVSSPQEGGEEEKKEEEKKEEEKKRGGILPWWR